MIAACPKCAARYRIEREKLRPEGVRLRCARCEAVFKVRPPEAAPAPAAAAVPEAPPRVQEPAGRPEPAPPAAPPPDAPLVLVAMPDAELAKQTAELLGERGLRTHVVGDGVEAMLEIQRRLPVAVLLSAQLPRMYGFQVCEIVKRNESLQPIRVVLAGAIHHKDRYRRPPEELYGADAYLEEPDLPEGLPPVLERIGVPMTASPAPRATASPRQLAPPGEAVTAVSHPPAAAPAPPPPAQPRSPARGPAADGLEDERAKAERLARIIVSDIVLYNEEKFARAIQEGCVQQAMEGDLAEGRGLFAERIDARVREEKDFLVEELLRVARSRGGA